MIKFLALISVLVASFLAVSAKEVIPPYAIFNYGEGKSLKYAATIDIKSEASFTGICILKRTNERIVGSMVNEFGIKAFDFVYEECGQSFELHNVISFFNKRFVKRTVKGDMRYLVTYGINVKKDKSRKVSVNEDGTIVLENLKHGIKYTLIPLV